MQIIRNKIRPKSGGIIRRYAGFTAGLLIMFSCLAYAQQNILIISDFEKIDHFPSQPWEIIQLNEKFPPTKYQVIDWDGVTAVEAVAEGSMALLARPVEVNLDKTPVLCWRWRVGHVIDSADLLSKAGDDYAARVYVSFKLPSKAIGFGTRIKLGLARKLYGDHVPDAAINYVWDNTHPAGTQVPNAYTDRTQMLVVRSGNDDAGRWVEERRDVQADFNEIFAVQGGSLIQVAIASDTDNTGGSARAGFADLHFVSRDQSCEFSLL